MSRYANIKSSFFMLLTLCIVASITVINSAFAGDFFGEKNPLPCSSYLSFIGDIESGNSSTLKIILERERKRLQGNQCANSAVISLNLDSKGGDVYESIKMGRIIRDNDVKITVGLNQKCLSSCVYLVAGGIDRILVGSIGIHRPYFGDLSNFNNKNLVRNRVENIDKSIVDYLKEMNVSLLLHEEAMSIPPEDIKILSDADLKRYRLDGEDMAYNERKIKERAMIYNITSSEYRRRKSLVDSQCGPKYEFMCSERIYTGLSDSVLSVRMEKFVKVCGNDKNERDLWDCYKRIIVLGR